MALYQPLTFLDLVVYHRDHVKINRIKEIKCLQPFQSLMIDIKKSAIAMFITEIINKTVREESHSQEMFDFIFRAITTLDALRRDYESYHLIFLVKLSRLLGFGVSSVNEVIGGRATNEETERLLPHLINGDYTVSIDMTNGQRRILLELLLGFYTDHIENLGEIRSVKVLQEVMN